MLPKTAYLIILVCIVCIPFSSVFAGGNAGQFGIGLSIVEESPLFMGRFWLSDKITIDPQYAFLRTDLKNDAGATEHLAGIEFFYHFRTGKDFRPLLGFGLVADMLNTNDKSYLDVYLGIAFGGEYFLSDHFSIQGKYQIQFIATDDEFSPSWLSTEASYLRTTQSLSAYFYF